MKKKAKKAIKKVKKADLKKVKGGALVRGTRIPTLASAEGCYNK